MQVRTGPKAAAETTFEMLECELGTTVLSLKQQVTPLLSPRNLEVQPERIAPEQQQNATSGAVQGTAGHGTCGKQRMLCAREHALVSVVHLVSQKADFASRPMNHAETCCLPCRHRAEQPVMCCADHSSWGGQRQIQPAASRPGAGLYGRAMQRRADVAGLRGV